MLYIGMGIYTRNGCWGAVGKTLLPYVERFAMSELFALEQCQKTQLLNKEDESPRSALSREAYLIGGGIKDGFIHRLNQAKEAPGLTALEFSSAAAVGAGLTAMSMAGGRWSSAAKIGTRTLEILAIGDGLRRLAPSAYAIGATLVNPENYLQNRATIARNIGSACFDYPLMLAGGFAGSKAVTLGSRAMPMMFEKFSGKLLEGNSGKLPEGNLAKTATESGLSVEATSPTSQVLKIRAHENPPGAWQQNVPEGSNVNWLNSLPDNIASSPKFSSPKFSAPESSSPARALDPPPQTRAVAAQVRPSPELIPVKTNKTAVAHENPPSSWQEPLADGSNVNWLR